MKRILSFAMIMAILVASVLTVPVAHAEETESNSSISVWDGTMPTVTATNIFTALGQDSVAGTETDPIILDSASDVAILAQFLLNGNDVWTPNKGDNNNGTPWFRLECDIDIAGYEWPGIGTITSDTKGQFKGKFDGNGHVIYNLDLASDDVYAGFFGALHTPNALVRNLGIASCVADGIDIGGATERQYVGGLVGYANRATIQNCFANVDFKSTSTQQLCIGILMGKCDDVSNTTTVTNSWCSGNIEIGTRTDKWVHAGVLCGEVSGKLIVSNCYAFGNINVKNSVAWDGIGAFVGQLSDSKALSVSNTAFKATVNMESALVSNSFVRAIIGYENGTESFTDCQYNVNCTANGSEIDALTYSGLTATTDEIKITSSTLFVNYGYQNGNAAASGKYKIRFVSELEVSPYAFAKAGYLVTISYNDNGTVKTAKDIELSDNKVYTGLTAATGVVTPENGKFFVANGITDIPFEKATFSYTPFVETADGVRIYGTATTPAEYSLVPEIVA